MDLPESASPEFQATRTESHVFLGYLLAVPTALSAFMLMGQPPTTRFEWVRISWFIILVSALNLPLMLPPFLLIRWLAKDRWCGFRFDPATHSKSYPATIPIIIRPAFRPLSGHLF
jgi:hypothetical protein